VAVQRPSTLAVATSVVELHLRLLGDFQSVVDFDAEVSDGAFKLDVPEQQLRGGARTLRTF
jgi:hypothetical protein